MLSVRVVGKITCPNGKICVGRELGDVRLGYFGSPARALPEQDADREPHREEMRLIPEHRSDDPWIGCDRVSKSLPAATGSGG
ncbi:hypothetical protein ACL02R_18405 [Streptomyces sp. MS19]|uniref:hypothetical protein n=1 Tax=Streptomyces sp. MS19 TaxID=3385972 RepID=UPI00399FFA0E